MNDNINSLENSILSVHNPTNTNDTFSNLKDESIMIKLKSITNKVHEININPNSVINDSISSIFKIVEASENDEIKLIFTGKLLKHTDTFLSYGKF